tara:strand:- start:47 stop:253 length:207 start_codon:yes stop_codon:yes gene_type:complete
MKHTELKQLIKEEIRSAINENGGWDYDLMEQIVEDVEQLDSEIGKYDDDYVLRMINSIIDQLNKLKNK